MGITRYVAHDHSFCLRSKGLEPTNLEDLLSYFTCEYDKVGASMPSLCFDVTKHIITVNFVYQEHSCHRTVPHSRLKRKLTN